MEKKKEKRKEKEGRKQREKQIKWAESEISLREVCRALLKLVQLY